MKSEEMLETLKEIGARVAPFLEAKQRNCSLPTADDLAATVVTILSSIARTNIEILKVLETMKDKP